MSERKSNGFGIGDVIFNGWAGDSNCYSLVIGRTSVRGEPCYTERKLFQGKLVLENSYSSIYADRREKIGHINISGLVSEIVNEHRVRKTD